MIKNDMRRLLFKGKKEVDDKGVKEWVEGSLVSTENKYFILQSKTKTYIPKGTHTLCSVNCYEVNKKRFANIQDSRIRINVKFGRKIL